MDFMCATVYVLASLCVSCAFSFAPFFSVCLTYSGLFGFVLSNFFLFFFRCCLFSKERESKNVCGFGGIWEELGKGNSNQNIL